MKNQKLDPLLYSIIFLLVVLWVYTATSKISDLKEFERQLQNQNLGQGLTSILLWAIPMIEIGTALSLVFKKTRFLGLLLSLFLMILFTGYVGLALIGFYQKVPCSCGGVLKNMGWYLHFWFNMGFLLLALIGCWIEKTNRKLAIRVEHKTFI